MQTPIYIGVCCIHDKSIISYATYCTNSKIPLYILPCHEYLRYDSSLALCASSLEQR